MTRDREQARARALAYRRLAARPRSRAELAGYLEKKGLQEESVRLILTELETAGYLDDRKFAMDYGRYLVEYRGLGRYALRSELRKKGVSDEYITPAIDELFSDEGYDEQELALALARKKSASLSGLADRNKAGRRLTDYLRRRGFSFDIISRVIKGRLND